MKRTIKTESGFTLLELLISLALVAVLVVSCLTAVRLATASREAGTQKSDVQQRLRIIHERLHSTLRSAHLLFVPAESESLLPDDDGEKSGESKILAFEGNPESIKFVTFSDKLMNGSSSPWMHEIRFYLQKNEDTGLLEILMNERDFSPKDFFRQDPLGQEKGQTLVLAQDVAYLKFRYYYEISEGGNFEGLSGDNSVKSSGEWTDTIITEPIDFKRNTVGNRDTESDIGSIEKTVRLPKAVEVSVGLWEAMHPKEGSHRKMVKLPPFPIPIQVGMVFERFEETVEEGGAREE